MSQQTLKQVLKFFKRNLFIGVLVVSLVFATLVGALIIQRLSPERDQILQGARTTSQELQPSTPPVTPSVEQDEIVTKTPPPISTMTVKTYTVVSGDSLWSIAENLYGDGKAYIRLAEFNDLSEPNDLRVGQEIKIFSTGDEVAALPIIDTVGFKDDDSSSVDTEITYTIQPGDSLWKIAEEQLNDPYSWTELYELNKEVIGENPNLIYPNMHLVLPPLSSPTMLVK